MANIEISTLTRNNDGNTYIIKDANAIPRSGGAVLTGIRLSKTGNDSELSLDGGTGYPDSATITLYGKNSAYGQGGCAIFAHDVNQGQEMWIKGDGTWTWNGTAVQLVSDQRLKQQISEIDDKLLDAWEDVTLCQFKYNDAVNEKGDNARLHTGYVVQQINEACQKHDVDISAYGLYCHEEYQERTEEVTIENEDGTTSKETKVIEPAREYYSLRYTETLVVECAYLRMKNKELQAQLDNLFNMVGKLTEKVGKLEGKLQ